MTLLLTEKELQEDKELLYTENILTEHLLESVLYCINKYAKNARDEKFDAEQQTGIDFQQFINKKKKSLPDYNYYLDREGEYDYFYFKEYYPEELFSAIEDSQEASYQAEQRKFNCYSMKEDLIDLFLKPICTHGDLRSTHNYGFYNEYWECFKYYQTENASFHIPIEGDDDLIIPLEENLYVEGRDPNDLLSFEYCEEIYEYIMNHKENISYQPHSAISSYPGDDNVFLPYVEKISELMQKRFRETMSSYEFSCDFVPDSIELTIPSVQIWKPDGKTSRQGEYVNPQEVMDSSVNERFIVTVNSWYEDTVQSENIFNVLEKFMSDIQQDDIKELEITDEDKFEIVVDNGYKLIDKNGKEFEEIEVLYDALEKAYNNKEFIDEVKSIIKWKDEWQESRGDDFLYRIFERYIEEESWKNDSNAEISPFSYSANEDFYDKGILINNINFQKYTKDSSLSYKEDNQSIQRIQQILNDIPREKLITKKEYLDKIATNTSIK